jgi:hypothetical protein
LIETSDDPPDHEKAKPIIEKYYVRKMTEVNGQKSFEPYTMGDNIDEFQKLGEGVYMYFCFLKFFGIVFLFFGLLMFLPVILMVLEENNSNESKANIFFRTMTANISSLQSVIGTTSEAERKDHVNKIFTIFLWFFFVLNILIFLSIVIFRIIVKRKRIQLSKFINPKGKKNLTIKSFTLEIMGLPHEKLKPLELEKFFQNIVNIRELGPVMNVTLAYKFKDSLENILQVSRYRLDIQHYTKKMSYDSVSKRKKMRYHNKIKVLKRKAVIENNLAKEKLGLGPKELIDYQTMQDKKVLKAFISFEDTETTKKLRNIINKVILTRHIMKTN